MKNKFDDWLKSNIRGIVDDKAAVCRKILDEYAAGTDISRTPGFAYFSMGSFIDVAEEQALLVISESNYGPTARREGLSFLLGLLEYSEHIEINLEDIRAILATPAPDSNSRWMTLKVINQLLHKEAMWTAMKPEIISALNNLSAGTTSVSIPSNTRVPALRSAVRKMMSNCYQEIVIEHNYYHSENAD